VSTIKDIVVSDNIAVKETDSLEVAIDMMHKSELGVIAVVRHDKAIGIITEKDIITIINSDIDMNTSVKSFFKFYFLITIHETRSIEHALHMFVNNSIRRLVVVDSKDKFIGMITQDYVLKHLDDDAFKTNLKISNFIGGNLEIISLNKKKTIAQAFKVMHDLDIGSIIAVDDNNKPVGILTEKDSIKILYTHKTTDIAISSVMSSPVITVYENAYVKDVVKTMDINKIRRVLVLDKNTNLAVSMLSTRDISHNLEGNYKNILESKLKNIKNSLNYIGESILEVYRDKDEIVIQWMNDSAINNFGNMIDKNLDELIAIDVLDNIYKKIKLEGECSKYKIEINKQYFELMCSHHFVGSNEILLIILRDISIYEKARMNAEEAKYILETRVEEEIAKNKQQEMLMFQQSRLAQMGEMISMIAHQWRQPLNSLSILTQTIYSIYKKKKLDNELMNEFNQDSKKQIQQMSRTIDDFRDFFKPENKKVGFFIDESISQALELLKPVYQKEDIDISFQMNREIRFFGYPNEFGQSLINIFNNSKDALIENDIKDKKISIKLQILDEKIVLEIRDNAGGIPQTIIDKIYDPYFSTKGEQNGTGLGLYMTKLIIEEHMQGKITISNVDKGVVVKIILSMV